MKNLILFLGICLLMTGCSKRTDFDSIVSSKWEECKGNTNCTLDFANLMDFEWDTMCFYSGACSLEDINNDLGFELKGFTDIGDRVIFLNKGKIVYQKEWYTKPSEPPVGTIFETDLKKFKVSKSDAKFRINKKGKAYYLTKL
ncbi:MAG: hypothetical protein JXR65_10465 [Bacteroidales bacterium]|nr:hypothetical protein [Bacteroidales bacterium]